MDGANSMAQFYDEVREPPLSASGELLSRGAPTQVSSIQGGLTEFSANVQQISELHSRTLNSTDESANQQSSALLDDLVTRTRQLSNNLKDRIQALTKFPAPRPQDARIRNNQVSSCDPLQRNIRAHMDC